MAGSEVRPTAVGGFAITAAEFELLQRLIFERFGIALGPEKKALLAGRLQSLLRKEGFTSFRNYYERALRSPTHAGLSELVDRISTNVTYFNREPAHFDFLVETALPKVVERLRSRNSHDLRVWCAAASTGEEPYLLGMLISEFLGAELPRWQAGVLATDISARALESAKRGVYPSEAVEKVPATLRQKYFQRLADGSFRVTRELRDQLVFRRFNLMTTQLPFKKPFDLVFCRNVMIYFTPTTRRELVSRIHRFISPEGYLFIAHSESLNRSTSPFEFVQPGVYQRRDA